MGMRISSSSSHTSRPPTPSKTSDQTTPNGTAGAMDPSQKQAMMSAAHSFMGGQLQKIMAKQKEDAQKLNEHDEDD